jgi:hypothetical protein
VGDFIHWCTPWDTACCRLRPDSEEGTLEPYQGSVHKFKVSHASWDTVSLGLYMQLYEYLCESRQCNVKRANKMVLIPPYTYTEL